MLPRSTAVSTISEWFIIQERHKLLKPGEEAIRAMLAWGVAIETDSARTVSKSQIKRKMSKMSLVSRLIEIPTLILE